MTGSDSALRAALRRADATGAPSDRQAAERALRLAGLRSDPVCVDYVRCVSGHVMLHPGLPELAWVLGEHLCDTCDQCGAAVDLYGVRYCPTRGEWTSAPERECGCCAVWCGVNPWAAHLAHGAQLADRHAARIGFWRDRCAGLAQDPYRAETTRDEWWLDTFRAALADMADVLSGAFGLSRLPADVARWLAAVEALFRDEDDTARAERESGA